MTSLVANKTMREHLKGDCCGIIKRMQFSMASCAKRHQIRFPVVVVHAVDMMKMNFSIIMAAPETFLIPVHKRFINVPRSFRSCVASTSLLMCNPAFIATKPSVFRRAIVKCRPTKQTYKVVQSFYFRASSRVQIALTSAESFFASRFIIKTVSAVRTYLFNISRQLFTTPQASASNRAVLAPVIFNCRWIDRKIFPTCGTRFYDGLLLSFVTTLLRTVDCFRLFGFKKFFIALLTNHFCTLREVNYG